MLRRNKIILIIAIIVVVIGVLGFSFRFQIGNLISGFMSGSSDGSSGQELGEKKLSSSLATARSKAAAGDTVAAQEGLDQAIEQTNSKEEKGQLYLEKANISVTDGKTSDAISAAAAAAENDPSISTFDLLGWLYEQSGDKDKAIQAYQNVIEQFNANPSGEVGQVSKEYYEMKINQLEAN